MNETSKEPLDRNKTALTHRVTATAMAYLGNRGFRPIETEVPVQPGWIADLASFVMPTRTEARLLRLNNQNRFGLTRERYGEVMFHYGPILTAIVEVKTSRCDFLKDKRKWNGTYPGHLCYLAYPKGVISLEEIPRGWLALEAHADGSRLQRSHWCWASVHPQHPGDVAGFIAAVAMRRDNRTRFAQHRLWLKMHRAGE